MAQQWRMLSATTFLALSLVHSGCAGPAGYQEYERQRVARAIDTSEDRMLVRDWSQSPLPGQMFPVSSSSFVSQTLFIDQDWVRLREKYEMPLLTMAHDVIQGYRDHGVDASRDAVAMRYVQMATQRGHVVRLYKASLNRAIGNLLGLGLPIEDADHLKALRRDLDPAMLEFDRNERIVSVLVRQLVVTQPGLLKEYVTRDSVIVSGRFARRVETQIGNAVLHDAYITTIPATAVQPTQ